MNLIEKLRKAASQFRESDPTNSDFAALLNEAADALEARRPHRRHRLLAEIEADSIEDIEAALNNLAFEMRSNDGRLASISGGSSYSWFVRATVDESMNHDAYFAALDRYLNAEAKKPLAAK